jgi:hypothetical protein
MHLVSVGLSAEEVRDYYEGFCNATLWPLYHDVIAQPEFHRPWWDAYVKINRRYAHAVAGQAAIGATVWVHDYQLQLVPGMLREALSDGDAASERHELDLRVWQRTIDYGVYLLVRVFVALVQSLPLELCELGAEVLCQLLSVGKRDMLRSGTETAAPAFGRTGL